MRHVEKTTEIVYLIRVKCTKWLDGVKTLCISRFLEMSDAEVKYIDRKH